MSGARSKVLIIGISGVTCGGKTTVANQLNEIIPNSKVMSQDEYFLKEDDPKHIWIPELNHVNYDILSSLDMEKMFKDIMDLTINKEILKINNQTPRTVTRELNNCCEADKNKIEFIQKQVKDKNLETLIVEGFSIFNYQPLVPLFQLKYYFTLTKEECYKRRQLRVYEPPDCPGYFEKCAWPEHLQQLNEVKSCVKDVTYFEDYNGALEQILVDLATILQ